MCASWTLQNIAISTKLLEENAYLLIKFILGLGDCLAFWTDANQFRSNESKSIQTDLDAFHTYDLKIIIDMNQSWSNQRFVLNWFGHPIFLNQYERSNLIKCN